jgi:hypothetical protein
MDVDREVLCRGGHGDAEITQFYASQTCQAFSKLLAEARSNTRKKNTMIEKI